MTDADKWADTHDYFPSREDCEELGLFEEYDYWRQELIVIFPDGSFMSEHWPRNLWSEPK